MLNAQEFSHFEDMGKSCVALSEKYIFINVGNVYFQFNFSTSTHYNELWQGGGYFLTVNES